MGSLISRRGCLLGCGLLVTAFLAGTARADPVLDWAETVDEITTKMPGLRAERARVIAWLAAFNALNAITPRYRSYAPAPPALPASAADQPAASVPAALAAALYTVLIAEPDADHPLLLRKYREALMAVTAAPEREAGVAVGQRAALLLMQARSGDRLGRAEPPPALPGPGVFAPDASAKMQRSVAALRLAPFGVKSVAAFDPGPPPAPGSAADLRDLTEAQAIGAATSATRSADQTAAALFWNSGGESDYRLMIKSVLEARKLDAVDLARIQALDAMVSVDGTIIGATFKEKYLHWRPETAFTGAHAAPTHRDPAWQPLVKTNNNADYPSGGGMGAGQLEVLLPRLIGMAGAVEWHNTHTRQTRRWASAAALADELAAARVWAGIHFRSAVDTGRQVGRRMASEILDTQLLPR